MEKFKLVEESVEKKVDFEKIDKEIENDKKIPSSYVEIKLPSMGKYGAPKSLHFRDYTFGDVMDLNVTDETHRNLCKVLTNLNFENYDISKLSEKDAVYILYELHRRFVDIRISKEVYIDESLDENEINKKENLDTVDINLNNLFVQNLGYDENDNLISDEFKIPFTIRDKNTNDKVKLRIPILEDTHKAYVYCQEFYKDDLMKYASIKSQIYKLQSIKDEEKQDEEFEKFYTLHEDECKEYYSFMEKMTVMVAKIVQAMQIVSYNDEKCDTLERQLELFNKTISSGVWNQYYSTLEKFNFGILENVEVFIPSLNKKEVRKIPFQISDFIPTNDRESNDRFVVEFD